MKDENVGSYSVVKGSFFLSIVSFLRKNGLLSVFAIIGLYFFVTNFFFVHWVREQTESVIRDPEIVGLTVEEYDGPNIFSAYTEAVYSFKDRESMFAGLSKLCRKYTMLGWEDRSQLGCKEDVLRNSKKDINTLINGGSHRFCVTEDVKISIYYPYPSLRKMYPWSVSVVVFARRSALACT